MALNPRPKLVYILPSYDPAIGSHFFHLYELLEASSNDLDIFLVIERAKETPKHFPFPVYCQRSTSAPGRFVELLFILFRERMRGRTYFYTHYSFFGGITAWLVTRIAGGVSYYWNAGMPWLYKRSFIEEKVFRFVLRHSTLVTGTLGLAALYTKSYGLDPRKIRVLPNWIRVERFQAPDRVQAREALGLVQEAKVILFVHHLSKRKGADLLPDIAEAVIEQEKRAIFYIVGDGPERKNLERAVSGKGIADRVRIMGEVPHRDIPHYFVAADVFLMPSEEEGFPHVLLEAMAAGVPYVASNVGGVREITPPILLQNIVDSRDVRSFARQIVSVARLSESDQREMKQVLQDWVRHYDLREVAPIFISLFI